MQPLQKCDNSAFVIDELVVNTTYNTLSAFARTERGKHFTPDSEILDCCLYVQRRQDIFNYTHQHMHIYKIYTLKH